MRIFLWVITFLMSIVALVLLISVALSAGSAPQQAAGAALALGIAAIPYVMARAYSELKDKD
jgi:hypothetical protein